VGGNKGISFLAADRSNIACCSFLLSIQTREGCHFKSPHLFLATLPPCWAEEEEEAITSSSHIRLIGRGDAFCSAFLVGP